MTIPSGVKARRVRRRRKEKEKLPKIVATFVCASSHGQRTHYDRTNNDTKYTYVDDLKLAETINVKDCVLPNPDPNPPRPLSAGSTY